MASAHAGIECKGLDSNRSLPRGLAEIDRGLIGHRLGQNLPSKNALRYSRIHWFWRGPATSIEIGDPTAKTLIDFPVIRIMPQIPGRMILLQQKYRLEKLGRLWRLTDLLARYVLPVANVARQVPLHRGQWPESKRCEPLTS
jgi:hypothetical protein